MAGSSSNPLSGLLASHGVVVLDGGLATELERDGADLRDPLWSARMLLDGPERIRAVHERFFLAGADLAITASYQASLAGFAKRGLSAVEARALIRRSVELAREAAERAREAGAFIGRTGAGLVVGSAGPYGAALADGSEYRGDYTLSDTQLLDFHEPRLEELLAAGADLIAIETMPTLREAALVAGALARRAGAPAWISFSCRDGERISDGTAIAAAVSEVAANDAVVALGVNCVPPERVEALLLAARGATGKPLVAYPNSGEQWDARARAWRGARSGADFGDLAPRWHAGGARLIGGCCRTTPETIASIRSALASRGGTMPSPGAKSPHSAA